MANNIVSYRDSEGRFTNRKQLKKVARLGPKAFEQAAGFLRISDGDNPLDQSAVHPETYGIVENIIKKLGLTVESILNNTQALESVTVSDMINESFGEVTINAVISELAKPSRDPRPEFKTATFAQGVNVMADLTQGMILEGVVSNVANFGAFVDIGVHQDGLVHISSITDKFISDPREIIKAGDIVKVKVLEVDVARKRISLTMRLDEKVTQQKPQDRNQKSSPSAVKKPAGNAKPQSARTHSPERGKAKKVDNAAMGNAFADAFAKLKK